MINHFKIQILFQDIQSKEVQLKLSRLHSLTHQLQLVSTNHLQENSFQRKLKRKRTTKKLLMIKKQPKNKLSINLLALNTDITKRESIITRNIDITILIPLVILIHQVTLIKKSIIIRMKIKKTPKNLRNQFQPRKLVRSRKLQLKQRLQIQLLKNLLRLNH